jgi:TIR domain
MEAKDLVTPLKIFYSYAPEDKPWRDELDRHLRQMKRSGWIISWYDRTVQPGLAWEQEIDAHLNTADIILLIISPAFMSSDYAYGIEIQRALERHDHGEARVVPILLRPTFWEGTPFGKLQALPADGKPITTSSNLDWAFSDIVQGLRKIVTTLLPRKIENRLREEDGSPFELVIIDEAHYVTTSTAAQLLLQEKIDADNFDVFLCHNSKDKPVVKQVGEYLKVRGILSWLDEWELRPGLPWQPILESQIERIKTAAVFVGEDGIGPWQEQEVAAFLREFVHRGCPVIPVLLENASAEPTLPLFLRSFTWIDFRKQDPDPWKQLLWGITGVKDYRY